MLRRSALLVLAVLLSSLSWTSGAFRSVADSAAAGVLEQTADGPSTRVSPSMAYDAAHQEVVLFGGSDSAGFALTDTWTWDGTAWTLHHPPTSPTPRVATTTTFDAAHGVVLLFGGQSCVRGCGFDENCEGACQILDDTWAWDGASWTQLQPPTDPPAAYGGMFYDPVRGAVVLFSPFDGRSWTWDGSMWTEQPPTTPPRHAVLSGTAYDEATGVLLRFGGADGPPQNPATVVLGETWTWDGTTWAQQHPPVSPPARAPTAMAYDAARQQVVLYGGLDASGAFLTDTWTWDGVTWTQQHPAVSPQLGGTSMAYDAAQRQVVLVGVAASTLAGQTWVWDGNTWTEVAQSTSRAPSVLPAAADR